MVGAALLLAALVAVILSVLVAPRLPIVVRGDSGTRHRVPVRPARRRPFARRRPIGGAREQCAAAARPRAGFAVAFVASMVVLPLAALGMLVAAIVLAARKHFKGSLRALAAMLALALISQMSGLEAANAGLPDVLALRGSAAIPPPVVAGTNAGSGGLAGAAGMLSGGAAASGSAGEQRHRGCKSGTRRFGRCCERGSDAARNRIVGRSVRRRRALRCRFRRLGAVSGETSEDLSNSKDRPRWRVGEFLRKLSVAQKYIRHADFDPAALALTLPNDANALDTFVRDSIGLDDYPGAMRGAKGDTHEPCGQRRR